MQDIGDRAGEAIRNLRSAEPLKAGETAADAEWHRAMRHKLDAIFYSFFADAARNAPIDRSEVFEIGAVVAARAPTTDFTTSAIASMTVGALEVTILR